MDRTGIMVLDVIAAFRRRYFHEEPDLARATDIFDRLYVSVNSSKIYGDPSFRFEKYFIIVECLSIN